jgi:Uma2 family endonuclease
MSPVLTVFDTPMNFGTVKLTDDQFFELCLANPELSMELTAEGKLIVMAPVGGESGSRELRLGSQLCVWNDRTELGEVFSSSTVFRLPKGAKRSPDAAWVELSRWQALDAQDRVKFPPIAPDFVLELRSATDELGELQTKMLEYQDNGVRLGLLIDPQGRRVEIYRLGQFVEVLEAPSNVDCNDVLPGFVLELRKIW